MSAASSLSPAELGAAVARRSAGGETQVSATGLASLENKVPFSSESRVNFGSIAKIATGLMVCSVWPTKRERHSTVLQAVIPTLTGSWLGARSIEALLTHRGGLFDYRTLVELRNYMGPTYVTRRDIAMLAVAQGPPADQLPQYSNTGYVLLRMALEAATGKGIEQLWTECIRGRDDLGFWVINPELPIAGRAWGYRLSVAGDVRLWTLAADDAGASNYWGSVQDALRLAEFVNENVRLQGGGSSPNAVTLHPYGASAARSDGWLVMGADGGFSAAVLVRDDGSISAAVTNRCNASAVDLIAGDLRGDEFQVPAYARAESPTTGATKRRDSPPADGTYRNRSLQLQVDLVSVDGRLVLSSGGRELREPEVAVEARKPGSIVLDFGHLRGVRLERVHQATP